MVSSRLLLIHGTIVTVGSTDPQIIPNGAVYIEDDIIVTIGQTDDLEKQYCKQKSETETESANLKIIDCKNRLVLPGLICSHGHFYGLYSRGLDLKCEPAKSFLEVLERLWWRLDRCLQADSNYYSALAFCVDAIKAGTTTIVDHHASPNAIENSLDHIANATLKAGVRSSLCYEVTDRNGVEGADKGIRENVRFIQRLIENPNPLLAASFGLHASFTCSDETLKKCVSELNALKKTKPDLPVGFHIHLAEGLYDVEQCKKEHGCTVTERLHKAGLLGKYSLVGHGVHITDEEMDILAKTETTLIHNPESNMNNAVGIPQIEKMMKKGVLVGLGTDGMTYDMLQEYKTSYLIHKHNSQDPRVMSCESFNMLFNNNSTITSKFFPHKVGKIEPNCYADLILIDYIPPTNMCIGSLPWHVMFGMNSGMVTHTIVGGKILMEERKLTMIDEREVMEGARAITEKVWSALPPPPQ